MEILKNKGKLGYTLLELILVLALFAIILSIAVPSSKIIFDAREKDELKTFRRDILFARNSAVVENCFYILVLDEKNNGYTIKREGKIPNKQESVKVVKFQYGIELNKNHEKTDIVFNSTGAPSNSTTIKLSNRKKEKIEISITPATGSVNLKIKK